MPIPKLVVALATTALQVSLQSLQHTKGPRPDELTVTTADYGTPLTRFLGARKFSCSIIWAKKLEVVEHTTKVKGAGKQTSYGTLATFGLAIADVDHLVPIQKVLKIWLDKKLAYDATGTGPRSLASVAGVNLDKVMRIYSGAEDQMPDPAYVDYCEGKYGPNSAPAFRGIGTIVFDKLPCDNFGNRVPNVEVLAVTEAIPHYPYETATTTQNPVDFAFGGSWAILTDGADFEWWDTATRTRVGIGPSAGTLGAPPNVAMSTSGMAYFVGMVQESGLDASPYFFSAAPMEPPVGTKIADNTVLTWSCTRALSGGIYTAYRSASGYMVGATQVSHTQSARDFCEDSAGHTAILFHPTGSSNQFTIECNGNSFTITGAAAARSGPGTAYVCYSAANDHFAVVSDGYFYAIDANTGAVKNSVAFSGTPQFIQNSPNRTTFWVIAGTYDEYSLADASLVRSLAKSLWTTTSDAVGATFDPINDAVWARVAASTTIVIRYLDRVNSAGVTLGDVVDVMCADAGLAQRDTSALTDSVAGYSWTRSTVKAVLDPLLDMHDVDARGHDFAIQFVPRGSAASGLLLTPDFPVGGKGSSRYKVTIKQDTDLPKILRVNFADIGHDQQPNNVLSPLPADSVDSDRDEAIDLSTYADTPGGAQQKADRYMRRAWNSRETVENALTAQCLAIEAADVTQLSLDGIIHTVRLDKQTFAAGGSIECTFIRDETGLAALNGASGPPMDARDPDVIVVPAPVRGFVVDAPYRSDSDADVRPLLYSGAGAYGELGFPGAVIYEATGAGASLAYDQLFGTFTAGATWGTCSSALGAADPWLWDRGRMLLVTLQSGVLTGCTEADIDVDPSLNLLLVGAPGRWEYVNYTTAVLQADGSYILSGFKRGRRGTEWACGLHQAGDIWVLARSLAIEAMGSDDIGDSLSFKAQALGRSLDAALAIDVDPYTAATLKPYAPARIKWTTDGTDMYGEIIRRTRVGGSYASSSWSIPLSETSEQYEIDILNGSGTVLRTITITGTNTFTYTGAQITADGGTVGIEPSYNAYQISDAVGRGFALAA